MKRVLGLLALGALTPMLQGVAADVLSVRWCPDLGLLLVVAIALCWRNAAGGVALAAVLGYATDLLSGSLFGQHALLRVFAFGAARFGSRHLNLRGALPRAIFVALLTVANALLLGVTSNFFAAGTGAGLVPTGDLLPHALMNALFAPLAVYVTERVVALLGDDDSSRRLLLIETGR